MTAGQVADLRRCVDAGGVAVFPADTVYGLACDPESEPAVERLYRLKGRGRDRPAAVMFCDRSAALEAIGPQPPVGEALTRLLPGPLTVLLANPRRLFVLACGPDPQTLGLRVPRFEGAVAPMAGLGRPVLQSSANPTGGADPRRLEQVDEAIRRGADLVVDGGELPGVPSTVVDLRRYATGGWSVAREGAVPREALERTLSSVGP